MPKKKNIGELVDRLAVLAAKINLFKITLAIKGIPAEQTLQDALQTLVTTTGKHVDVLGSYQADDHNGTLDDHESIIKNLVITTENLTSATNRIADLEINKADKSTTDALQVDINNIITTITSQELWKGEEHLDLTHTDNTIDFQDANLIAALQNVPVGKQVILKVVTETGTPISVFLDESIEDNSFTSNSFNGDKEVEIRLHHDKLEMNGLSHGAQGLYKITEIRTATGGVAIDLTNLAQKDLSNVNVGIANIGKVGQVAADGTLEWVDSHAGSKTPDERLFDISSTQKKKYIFINGNNYCFVKNSAELEIGNNYGNIVSLISGQIHIKNQFGNEININSSYITALNSNGLNIEFGDKYKMKLKPDKTTGEMWLFKGTKAIKKMEEM